MNALVTGASGFLGQHLCSRLAAGGNKTVGLVHLNRTHLDKLLPVSVVSCDVRDLPSLRQIIARHEVDTVFHLAAQTQVGIAASNPYDTFDVNVRGTLAVLEACRLEGVERVLVASSDKVYGECKDVTEDTCMFPKCSYSASKVMAEHAAASYKYNHGMSIVVTRCGNLYGPGDTNYRRLVPSVCRSLARRESPVLRDRNRSVRHWLYVEDAVDAMVLLSNSQECGPFNIAGDTPASSEEIADELCRLESCKAGGKNLKPEYAEANGANELKHQTLNCDRIYNLTGWRPKTSLEAGLRNALRWYCDAHGRTVGKSTPMAEVPG